MIAVTFQNMCSDQLIELYILQTVKINYKFAQTIKT